MTTQRNDEMPDEIWADNRGWHTPYPHMYGHAYTLTKYTRADLRSTCKFVDSLSPPGPENEESAYQSDLKKGLVTMDYNTGVRTRDIIGTLKDRKAMQTQTAIVDTIAVPREVLQGVRDALLDAHNLAWADCLAMGKVKPRWYDNATKNLATLDAVLGEGE